MTDRPRDAWHAALQVIKTLRANGHVALLAGGCVRDRLLNHVPKDYDVATDATPVRVKELFPRAREVGAKFGVVLIRKFDHDIEVATFRTDGPYSDGRHPDAVRFGSEVEDAQRRDFTINGLFMDPFDGRVIDHVGGQADLRAGIVRAIGDPDGRFREDHLRMLRAIRFAARLGFEIEAATADAIRNHAEQLRAISTERVWMELEMILTDPTRAPGWSLLTECGLRDHLTSTWPHNADDDPAIQARLTALSTSRIDPALGLAVVLHTCPPPQAKRICRAFRLSNHMSGVVVWLISSLPAVYDSEGLELADLKFLMAKESWPDLLELLRVDLAATGGDPDVYESIKKRAAVIPSERIAPPPLLTGDDLSAMGMSSGPEMGEILKSLYRGQLNEQITSREQAVARARRLMHA